jgi:hypothetical protein
VSAPGRDEMIFERAQRVADRILGRADPLAVCFVQFVKGFEKINGHIDFLRINSEAAMHDEANDCQHDLQCWLKNQYTDMFVDLGHFDHSSSSLKILL